MIITNSGLCASLAIPHRTDIQQVRVEKLLNARLHFEMIITVKPEDILRLSRLIFLIISGVVTFDWIQILYSIIFQG